MHRLKTVEYDDEDLYDGEDGETDGGQTYTADDRENFTALTPVVRAELEEAGVQVSDIQIEEALWHYFWDVDKSVAYLKNSKQPRSQQTQAKKEAPKAKSKFDEAAEQSAQKAEKLKAAQSVNGLEKKAEALKLDASQPKVRSKNLDVAKLWADEKSSRKSSAAFVVIGHVDHGKSTLMGRLLLDTGAVAQRDIDRYKKQATERGKSSFALAWVMDTGADERERGVTVDIAQHPFSTETANFTILDAPGHRDFVPNMIGGASMADLALLVVDANQLESGMKGQTLEHILLAYAIGIRHITVVVNKLDSTHPAWSEESFQTVKAQVAKLLLQTGFTEDNIAFVPCSGLSGENVVKPSSEKASAEWVTQYPTLLKQLETSIPPPTTKDVVQRPFRMQITDVFKGGLQNPISISGRLASGTVQIGDFVKLQPGAETATIKGIDVGNDSRKWAVAGEICNLHLADINVQYLRVGSVICAVDNPVPVVKSVTIKVHALESLLPQRVDVHAGRLHVAGAVRQLVATLSADGEILRRKPRLIKAGQSALVKVVLEEAIPSDAGDSIVLRAEGSTVAFGTVQEAAR